jgi:hypothetical protein
MDTEGSLSCSQERAAETYRGSDKSSPYPHFSFI